jgi:hypothetical protein
MSGREDSELRPSKGLAAQPLAVSAPPTPAALRRRRRLAIGIGAGVLTGAVALAVLVSDEADDLAPGETADEVHASGARPVGQAPPGAGVSAHDESGQPGQGAPSGGARAAPPGGGEAPPAGSEQAAAPEAQAGGSAAKADGGTPVERAATESSTPVPGKSAAQGHKTDGGVAPVAKAAGLALGGGSSVAAAAIHADGGVRAASDGGAPDAGRRRGSGKGSSSEEGGGRGASGAAQSGRAWVNERSRVDEEDSLTRLDRFVAGGSTLTGRVIAAETGKPIEGATVHAHSGGAYVEAYTNAQGTFRVEGMPAKSHAIVWVDRAGGSLIAERLEITIGAEGQASDAGTIRLLRGDELRAHAPGWVGLFVSRRGTQLVAGAVSAWLPADKADIQVGDEILSIDGHDTAGLGPRAATFLLRGAVGASTTIVVKGHGGAKRTLKLERVPR